MGRLLIQFAGTNTTKALSETLPKNTIIVDEDLHQLRLHDGTTQGGHIIGTSGGSGVPVGTIIPFAGNSIPEGYLSCDGSAISRTDYATLFAVIGTIHGSGDGNLTFNLPDMRGRYFRGWTNYEPVGKYLQQGLPNITGSFDAGTFAGTTNGTGAFTGATAPYNWAIRGTYTQGYGANYPFNASNSNSIYGRYGNVIPESISILYIIKYR